MKVTDPFLRRLLDRLGASLAEFGIDRRAAVVAAHSGGVDSTALLWLLCRLPRHRRPEIEAVCVDHGLRPESSRDARRAVEIARSLGVPARAVRVECGREGGIEAGARRARYAALANVAAGRPILTAHTADDQAETVLYRLAKGAGRRGLGGIRPQARVEGGRILRPLLGTRRCELEEVIRRAGLEVVEDPTNAASVFVRNRIRREILPGLEAVVPGATAALARAAALARDDEAYLARRAGRMREALRHAGGGVDARRLARLPRALASRIVRSLAAEVGQTPSAVQVEAILGILCGGGEVRLSDAWVARCHDGRLAFEHLPRERRIGG